jgi:phosphoglycerate kinase
MEIKKIQDADVENKKVLVRADFNVSIVDGKVQDDFKLAACKKTVEYLSSQQGAKIALASHFGRPDGKANPEFSLKQIQNELTKILGKKIIFVSDCIGNTVSEAIKEQKADEIILLENVRFYGEEEKNDLEFSKKLAENFDVFMNDAFSVCHRNQASVTGVTKFLPSYAGFWLQKEIVEMEKIENDFAHPAVAIIGGAKIETKLPVIKVFEEKYDYVLVGGKIANEALDQKIEFSAKVMLPFDFIDDRLDIGPKTLGKFKEIIKTAKTIVWNGPVGKFEEAKYAIGTNEISKAILESNAYTVVGGGETIEVLEKNDAVDKISFVSTGGGAMLEYLSGNILPGIKALEV